MSVVPNKAKQLLLILKGTWVFITEVMYLYGTCFRGIFQKSRLRGRAFVLCDLFLPPRLHSRRPGVLSTEWKCDRQVHSADSLASGSPPCSSAPQMPPWETAGNGGGSTLFVTFGLYPNISGNWGLPYHLEPPHHLKHSESCKGQSPRRWHLSGDREWLLGLGCCCQAFPFRKSCCGKESVVSQAFVQVKLFPGKRPEGD